MLLSGSALLSRFASVISSPALKIAGQRRYAAAAFYTHVPPGSYRFQLQATTWCSRACSRHRNSLTFLPHFYQSTWFYLLCFFVIASVAVTVFLLHRRRLQQRFEAVLAERNRVARKCTIQLSRAASVYLPFSRPLTAQTVLPEKSSSLLNRARLQIELTVSEASSGLEVTPR